MDTLAWKRPGDGLLPLPRRIEVRAGAFELRGTLVLDPPPGFASPALASLQAELQARGMRLDGGPRSIQLVLDGHSGHPREGYGLTIGPERVQVIARKGVGLNHGLRTLVQLLRAADWNRATAALPALAIEDAPAFERRGVMLDVSRDRVPRSDYLFALVERLAEWKLNELQLYFEHTFAYREHARVWGGADPFTPDEIRALDRHCAAHGIELVPNQQSFGHLHHWLKHPAYRHLAEVPAGIRHPFLGAGETEPEPFSLCPTDPRSLRFLGELYDELLPCFTSGDFNVGLDETIDLGPGRSAGAIRARGVGRVYLGFLESVQRLVSARGKRMQFWADILLHHPELVPEVPKDAVPCLWGYEADHPFEAETRILAEAGLSFYVCPGTSSWQSIGGRLENMLANVASAARWGSARGAKGLLVTDWGDRGHLQPPCTSWPGFLVAADLAWNPDADVWERSTHLPDWLARHAGPWNPRAHGSHESIPALARAAGLCGVRTRNASPLSLLLTQFEAPFPTPELNGLDSERLGQVADFLDRASDSPPASDGRPDFGPEAESGRLLAREVRWAGELMGVSCALGRARLQADDGRPLEELAEPVRRALFERLEPLIAEYRRLWPERSRPGGLERSALWLERILVRLGPHRARPGKEGPSSERRGMEGRGTKD